MPAKVLILGMDAANSVLLSRWAREGKLPAFRSLIERGTYGQVQSTRGFFVGATWRSFSTGSNPAAHGLHRIVQLKPGTYDLYRPLDATGAVGGKPFWRLASNAGRRVAVLDVPLSRLEANLNGLQVVEWGGHDSVFGFMTTPPQVASEVLARVGAYPAPLTCDGGYRTAAEFEQFITSLELAVEKKTDLTLELLAREDWDLFAQVFTEAHCVGHQCWHIHDHRHPAHDPQVRLTTGDPLERVYRSIDRAVGAIVERSGAGQILLVAPHGMSYFRGASFLLPEILFRLGVAVRPEQSRSRSARNRAKAAGRAVLPDRAQDWIRPLWARLTPRRFDGEHVPSLEVDLERSACFPLANGHPVGSIRLNLAGREPLGRLEPGPEADAFCEDLIGALQAVIDMRTGEPLVADVLPTDSLYAGARRSALPDLLVEWSGQLPTGTTAHGFGRGATIRATSARIGTVEGSNSYGRTGDHTLTGFFVWAGRGVPAATRHEPVSVMDFHPTICRSLGLADPSVDGVAIGV